MKILSSTLALAFILFYSFSCTSSNEIELFNGENLNNWSIFVSDDTPADSVFWVEDETINVSGIPHSYIKTAEEYENYKLHVEWRWVAEPTNSGVLLHVTGEDMIWPNCIEAQLMHTKAGMVVLIGEGAGITIRDEVHLIESEENRYAVIEKFLDSKENTPGEWNEYDITVQDGTLELKVNGYIQNVGSDLTKTKGHIAIQSEGSPMQFRNIRLVTL
jgi:hypothetical protein